RKIGTSRRYEPEPDGLRAMTALVVLREKVIRPLLAASQRPESQIKPNHPTPVIIMNISGSACEISSPRSGWPHRIGNSFFIFFNKQVMCPNFRPGPLPLDRAFRLERIRIVGESRNPEVGIAWLPAARFPYVAGSLFP